MKTKICRREHKFCEKCNKVTQHQNQTTCRSCLSRRRRADPIYQETLNKRVREYRRNNKDKRRTYENNRLKSNPSARLASRLRNWINKLILRKSGNAASLVGCSFDELKLYLESKFLPGMTWDNWGTKGWHIDHIRPLASFDLSDTEQQKAAFNYTNLQPLWWQDNIRKGDIWEEETDGGE